MCPETITYLLLTCARHVLFNLNLDLKPFQNETMRIRFKSSRWQGKVDYRVRRDIYVGATILSIVVNLVALLRLLVAGRFTRR